MSESTTQESQILIRPLDIDRDAEPLARMWNESDLAWPGSWTDGIPITAEMVREWEVESRNLAVYVAEVDGEIAGYCSFTEGHHGSKGEGYLALLNVNPRFHGKSIGRRLIQETIKRSVQEGWKRQTLGTWSANFRAVPAYKRTGHFWTPDTSVWMQNFIPGALQLSLAKPFFEKHDWYSCYVREVTQEPDDERWEGIKVFTQRWEAGGERLTIWVDREARQMVAVENDDLLVAAIPSDIEPLAGSTVNITWRVRNNGAEPLHVFLHALGDKGLEIDHRDAFVVPGGETVERTAPVKLGDDAPNKKDDGTAPAVRSVLRIGEHDVELFCGLRARKPLSLSTSPADVGVRPGRGETMWLQLRSELDEPVAVTIRLAPPDGLVLDWTEKQVDVPAKAHVAVPVAIEAAEEAAFELPVTVEPSGDRAKRITETLAIFAVAPGGMVHRQKGSSLRLETDSLRVSLAAKEARLKVEHKAGRFMLLACNPTVGPPYRPSFLQDKEFSLDVEQHGARVEARLSAEVERLPGLWLHETITFSPAGVGTVALWLENRGSATHEAHVRLNLGTPDRDAMHLALPLGQEVVHTHAGQYPVGDADAPRNPAAYAEPWVAWEFRGASAGLAWEEHTARINHGWRASIDSAPFTLGPGERSPCVRYTICAADGDWQGVRRTLLGSAKADSPETRAPLQARLDPRVVATLSADAHARLVVDSTSARAEQATVELPSSNGLRAAPDTVSVKRLIRGDTHEEDVHLRLATDVAGVFSGRVRLRTDLYDVEQPFVVVRPGTEQAVSVSEGESEGHRVFTVDNGASSLLVAPDFGPSVIAWNVNGQNQLFSPFPRRIGFSWVYPWFGGIYPQLVPAGMWGWEGYLHRERVGAQAVTVHDAHGLPWTGVRLGAKPQKKELQGLAVEVDCLTLGESPVVKVIYRVRNLRPTEERVNVGLLVSPSLGGRPTDLTGMTDGVTRRPTNWSAFLMGRSWSAVWNEGSGRTMLLVGRRPNVGLQDCGQYGRILGSWDEMRLKGDEVGEYVYYLVLADAPDAARQYLVLRDL